MQRIKQPGIHLFNKNMLKRICLVAILIAIMACFALPFIRTESDFPYTGSWVRHEKKNQITLEFAEGKKLFYKVNGPNVNSSTEIPYVMQGVKAIAVYKSVKGKLKTPEFRDDTTYTINGYYEITPSNNGNELKAEQTKFVYVDEKTGHTTTKNFSGVSMIYHKVPKQ